MSSTTGAGENPPPLYSRMMRAIRTQHSVGNSLRMLKLPLVMTEEALYASAISQFFILTRTLEEEIERKQDEPMVARVRGLGLECTGGYASDLQELSGDGWLERAERSETEATKRYRDVLREADATDLTAAAFILYGALVVGGGRSTQKKVRKWIPNCSHSLYDVANDMKGLRSDFQRTFTAIGEEFPAEYAKLETSAARFMSLNNKVILSIRVWGFWCNAAAVAGLAITAAIFFAKSSKHV